jgi:hypothetical protein
LFLFKGLHSLAARRGDGLRPELLDHLARREVLGAANVEELSAHRTDHFRQAGPNPVGRIVAEASDDVLPFHRNGAHAANQTEPEGSARRNK